MRNSTSIPKRGSANEKKVTKNYSLAALLPMIKLTHSLMFIDIHARMGTHVISVRNELSSFWREEK